MQSKCTSKDKYNVLHSVCKKDLGILVGDKLNMSPQHNRTAKKTNVILGYINRSSIAFLCHSNGEVMMVKGLAPKQNVFY